MIERVESYFSFGDERGTLTGLVNFSSWEEANLISSIEGIERGNHYHKETTELFVILDGKIKVSTQLVENGKTIGEVVEEMVSSGDVFLIKANILHTFVCLEKSKWINMLDRKMDQENPDIHRIVPHRTC